MHRRLGKLAKDDNNDKAKDIAAELDLTALDALFYDGQMILKQPFKDAGRIVLTDLKYEDLFETVDTAAGVYAQARAAEMIGKKWVDGELVDNPNAEWVITDATRDMVQQIISDGINQGIGRAEIAQNIIDSDAFSQDRAELIARTEVADAASQGQLGGYKAMRDNGVDIEKQWRADEDPCEDCIENEDAGAIPLDDDFPSGDDAPPAHPRCECTILSVVYENGEETEEDGDDA